MKYNVFAFYRMDVGAYGQPSFTPLNKDSYVESVTRTAKAGALAPADVLDVLQLYYLGTYDDVQGAFETDKATYCLDLRQFSALSKIPSDIQKVGHADVPLEAIKEVVKDGTQKDA